MRNTNDKFKYILVGDVGVGKTAIINRYIKKTFDNGYVATIGFQFASTTIELQEDVKIQIWDTAGQEAFRALASCFYKTADAAVLVFSVNNKKSLINLQMWYQQIKKHGQEKCLKLVVGSKTDLDWQVDQKQIEQWLTKHNIHKFYKTSAKQDKGIDDLFIQTTQKLYQFKKKQKSKTLLKLQGENIQKTRSCC